MKNDHSSSYNESSCNNDKRRKRSSTNTDTTNKLIYGMNNCSCSCSVLKFVIVSCMILLSICTSILVLWMMEDESSSVSFYFNTKSSSSVLFFDIATTTTTRRGQIPKLLLEGRRTTTDSTGIDGTMPTPTSNKEKEEEYSILMWTTPSSFYEIDSIDIWESSPLPNWIKGYFRWHKETRQQLHTIIRSNTIVDADVIITSFLKENRITGFLYVTCLSDYNKCGGTADRLISLPFFIKLAAQTHRLLLIHWTKPAALTEYLVPPVHGMDWRTTIPADDANNDERLQQYLTMHGYRCGVEETIVTNSYNTSLPVLQVKFQSHDHGSVYYNAHATFDSPHDSTEDTFESVFGYLWEVLFTPSVRIQEKILQQFQSQPQFYPGKYTSAHVRALYNTKTRSTDLIHRWTINAIQCAIQIQTTNTQTTNSGYYNPVYFASDSDIAVTNAISYGTQTLHNPNAIVTLSTNSSSSSLLLFLHLDKTKDWRKRPASDFDSIFIDMYMLALGSCVTYGMGGYGYFASLLSTTASTTVARQKQKSQATSQTTTSTTTCKSLVHMTAVSSAQCKLPRPPQRRHATTTLPQSSSLVVEDIFLPPMTTTEF